VIAKYIASINKIQAWRSINEEYRKYYDKNSKFGEIPTNEKKVANIYLYARYFLSCIDTLSFDKRIPLYPTIKIHIF
jgi:hypothetical protein